MTSSTIVGREEESAILQSLLDAREAQFLALYGRRRIGKTYLIREFFRGKGQFLQVTGLKDGNIKTQLSIFTEALSAALFDGISLAAPRSWQDAFSLLTEQIKKSDPKKPFIIFLDELPWLATKRSGLIQALDHIWNTQWVQLPQVKLIVCGSAAAWMLDKIINDKGGLHNRITKKMLLQPFTLKQTQAFLRYRKFKLSEKHLVDYYMVTGGVAFYLESMRPTLSTVQNIQALCFNRDSLLLDEFDQLYRSLFDNYEEYIKIIKAIAEKRSGLTREEIIRTTKLKTGGHLNKRLQALEAAGFIRGFTSLFRKRKDGYYRVVDEYSLFYLSWIEPHKKTGFQFPKNYWQSAHKSPAWASWAGNSFEAVCIKHVEDIKHALGLDHTIAMPGVWRHIPSSGKKERGAQIDLLFDRGDDAMTLCEIKYCEQLYRLDKAEALSIDNKVETFRRVTKTKKQLFVILITVSGVKPSLWLDEVIDQVVDMKGLLKN